MLIIGDMHTGVKAGLQMSLEIYHEYFARFLKDIFKYVDANGVKNIVLLGDVFDVRKHLNSGPRAGSSRTSATSASAATCTST
jgi:metallophosphoesterase superfamily enzyme